jgi:hypothetical protein
VEERTLLTDLELDMQQAKSSANNMERWYCSWPSAEQLWVQLRAACLEQGGKQAADEAGRQGAHHQNETTLPATFPLLLLLHRTQMSQEICGVLMEIAAAPHTHC